MEIVRIQRHGYGSQFNDLYILYNCYVHKQTKNEYGIQKMRREIMFLQYIQQQRIPFSIPTLHDYGKDYYIMEYCKDYLPLYQYFQTATQEEIQDILGQIRNQLDSMHQCTKQSSSLYEIVELLRKETKVKIYQRYEEIKSIIDSYSTRITQVNNLPIRSFDDIMQRIEKKVQDYVESMTTYELCLIHGDCQFNNILYHPITKKIVFIDPRGYFGDKELFGVAEYDEAKIRFALTGYDVFDNLDIKSLDIQDGNLILPNLFVIEHVDLSDFIGALTISIWLGNAHCFKDNPAKAVFSFYYALYLGTLYL
jgi:hypothetical protein